MGTLNLGKIRALSQLSTPQGIFTMTAYDHRGSLVKSLGKALGRDVSFEEVVFFKSELTRVLAPLSSAVLIDPEYGAGQVVANRTLPGQCGLLVTYEETGYTEGDKGGRVTTLLPDWNVCKIRLMGAQGVKVLLYYHPDAPNAAQQEELVVKVAEECTRWELPLFLEPICYPLDPNVKKSDPGFAAERPDIVIESARRLVPLGVDVLKAEFPTDAAHEQDESRMATYCRRLTESIEAPWVLLSAGVDFETFAEQVRIACQNGASGFLAGRAIWKESVGLEGQARREFLETTAADRLRRLGQIALAYGRPWQAAYASQLTAFDLPADWYKTYGTPLCE